MSTEIMNEEMVETTVEVAEAAVESVTASNGSFGKAALILGGLALAGVAIYKGAKFIKAKHDAKKADKQYAKAEVVEPDFTKSEDEESDK